jgi:hypothetical protein
VPGICHMDASSTRQWVAMARNDQRAVYAEIKRQERAVGAGVVPPRGPRSHRPRRRRRPGRLRRDEPLRGGPRNAVNLRMPAVHVRRQHWCGLSQR